MLQLLLLLRWTFLQILYGFSEGQLVLKYGKPDSQYTGIIRVINNSVTWRDAHAACLNMGFGKLMHAMSNGGRAVYTRKLLIENGWPDMPLWIGYMKDASTNKWKRMTTTCSFLNNADLYDFGNDLPDTQLCVLVNMNISSSAPAWYGAPCDEKHAFICEETAASKTTKTKEASLVTRLPSSQLTTTYDCPAACCRNKIVTQLSIPAVQVNIANESCVQLSDEVFLFPLPYYVNLSATADTDVIEGTTEITVEVLNDNGTIDYTWNTVLSCFVLPETTTTMSSAITTYETSVASESTTVTEGTTLPQTKTSTPQTTTSTPQTTTSASQTTTSTPQTITSASQTTTSVSQTTTLSTSSSSPITSVAVTVTTSSVVLSGRCLYHNSSTNYTTTCRTFCRANKTILTDEMLRRWLLSIIEDLTLNKKLLSSYIRNHISADDNRVTAKVLGWSGVCLMLSFFSVIFISDAINLFQGQYSLVRSKESLARYAVTKAKKGKSINRKRVLR